MSNDYYDDAFRSYYRFEKHSTKKYFYEELEFEYESIDEMAFSYDILYILDQIKSGEIDARNLTTKT